MLVTPTPRCLASIGMLRLSIETCGRDFESAGEDFVGVDRAALPTLALSDRRGFAMADHPAAANVTGSAVGERNGCP